MPASAVPPGEGCAAVSSEHGAGGVVKVRGAAGGSGSVVELPAASADVTRKW